VANGDTHHRFVDGTSEGLSGGRKHLIVASWELRMKSEARSAGIPLTKFGRRTLSAGAALHRKSEMDGPDHAAPFDALPRQLRRIDPPTASIGFRHRAWRKLQHALDPIGTPRALPETTANPAGERADSHPRRTWRPNR